MNIKLKLSYTLCFILLVCSNLIGKAQEKDYTAYVNRFIGTDNNGVLTPTAAVPFGMVQCGPNTTESMAGYFYNDSEILGFSHVNKSGGGCSDLHDILFVPLNADRWDKGDIYPEKGFPTAVDKEKESAAPGYYQVTLDNVKAELTTTSRCAFHRYTYKESKSNSLAIDLRHGAACACTIVPEDSYDTIMVSNIKVIDEYTVQGTRISDGWADEQHVYFYAKFSKSIAKTELFSYRKKIASDSYADGSNVRSIFTFDFCDDKELLVKVGISPVSCDGARKNLEKEIQGWDFEKIRANAKRSWNEVLSNFKVETDNLDQKTIFYSSVYNVFLYPTLYSDVDGQFRGSDLKVHTANGFDYYGGVIGLWDTFRAAVPLLTLVKPDIANEYVQTFLEHYKYFGQLPIWTLAGQETFQMLGLHSLPVIADCYFKGIRDYDVEAAYEAMKVSAMKDTCGYSMRYFVGLINYKKYGYVPGDLEVEATARTLEYAYDDYCIAQLAKALGKKKDYKYFMKRSKNYKNVYDKEAGFMNGRLANGEFRSNLNPYASSHRADDFCEGNAWQWTFFAPHDVSGLAKLFGGYDELNERLDDLFSASSNLEGKHASGDISGLIGQYAHGNEPSHHIAYMYNPSGQPWKTQKYVHEILTTQYKNEIGGWCGQDDTGQMSAWYIFSSMGFYPMDPVSQIYEIGSPLFPEVSMKLGNGKTFKVTATNLTNDNIYIQSAKLNGQTFNRSYITFDDLSKGGKLEFVMGNEPNIKWGNKRKGL